MLAAAAGLLILLTSAETWLRSEPFAGVSLQSALANERDDHGYVAHTLQNFGAPGQPDIIVVGTSALREGLLAAPIMERRVKERFGPAARFHNLSTLDQTPTEALAIVGTTPLTRATVVVVEIKPRRFTHSAAELADAYEAPRIPALRDKALLEFLTTENLIGRLLPPSLWRHRNWFRHFAAGRVDPELRDNLGDLMTLHCRHNCLSRLAATAWFRAPHRYLAYAYPDMSLPDDELRSLRQGIASVRVPEFLQNHDRDTAALGAVIDLARRDGATVLLVDPPRHPYSLDAYAPVDAIYRKDIATLAQRGAKYLEFSRAAQIRSSDFYDLDHLRPSGRTTFSQLFIDALDEQLHGAAIELQRAERDPQ